MALVVTVRLPRGTVWSDIERYLQRLGRRPAASDAQGVRLPTDILELAWQGFTEH